MPMITTGIVITVPIAACGPYRRPSEALWNLLSKTGMVDTFGQVLIPAFASVTIYALMAVILLVRPAGLFPARASA